MCHCLARAYSPWPLDKNGKGCVDKRTVSPPLVPSLTLTSKHVCCTIMHILFLLVSCTRYVIIAVTNLLWCPLVAAIPLAIPCLIPNGLRSSFHFHQLKSIFFAILVDMSVFYLPISYLYTILILHLLIFLGVIRSEYYGHVMAISLKSAFYRDKIRPYLRVIFFKLFKHYHRK